MELFRHKVKIKSILFRNASEVMSALIAAWKVLGIPEYSQFDNQQVFSGSERRPRWFSKIIKLCLSLEIEPVFIPFREPWRTAEIERFNDVWDKLIQCYLLELKEEPEDDYLLWQLGDIYLQSGKYQKALEIGKYHYKIHPESPNIVQNLLSVLEKLGKPVEEFSWRGNSKILKIEDKSKLQRSFGKNRRGQSKFDLFSCICYLEK